MSIAPTHNELTERRRRQTDAARSAFQSRFSSDEEQREHFRRLGKRSAASRVVLTTDEASALCAAYEILGRIAERARLKLGPSPQEIT